MTLRNEALAMWLRINRRCMTAPASRPRWKQVKPVCPEQAVAVGKASEAAAMHPSGGI